MAGLTVAALLARSGRRVLVVEAHDVVGGYAHTFTLKDYRFCAQVHCIFSCAEGESVHTLLRELGVVDRVPFVRLDPDGFDHAVIAGERFRIPNGLAKFEARLLARYPQPSFRAPIRRYFSTIAVIAAELAQTGELPSRLTPVSVLRSLYRFRHVARYARWTLEDFYDNVKMPPRLRAILAGQSGDYLFPPRDVSFLLHVALVTGYDRGAYYPRHHFFHFVDTIANAVRSAPGCAILLEHEVDRIHVEGGRVSGITTTNGKRLTASRYVSNVDPRRTAQLAGEHHFGRRDRRRLPHYVGLLSDLLRRDRSRRAPESPPRGPRPRRRAPRNDQWPGTGRKCPGPGCGERKVARSHERALGLALAVGATCRRPLSCTSVGDRRRRRSIRWRTTSPRSTAPWTTARSRLRCRGS